MDSDKLQIVATLLRVLQKYVINQRTPRDYGSGEPLYPAEIHMVMHIGDRPGQGVTDLAKIAGVTKGAVSQMLQRLDDKGLIHRETSPESDLKVSLSLTKKGLVAYHTHQYRHEEEDKELLDYLDNLAPKEIRAIETFLTLLERGIDRRNET